MKKFPLHIQHDAMQCGIACLRMITEYFGEKYTMDELEQRCPATSEGVSMLSISRAAEELGLHTVSEFDAELIAVIEITERLKTSMKWGDF